MSDRKNSSGNTGDGAFDRDLALTSRAYKGAESSLPPPAMDDAIRAAARRAVKSQPHRIDKSWMSRWSAPLSAAALVVLTVSVGFLSIDEQPELAPTPLKKALKVNSTPMAASPTAPPSTPEAPAAVVAQSSRAPQAAAVVEKKVQPDRQDAMPRDQIAEATTASAALRRSETGGTATGRIAAKETESVVAFKPPAVVAAPAPAAAPPPPAREAQAFVAEPPAGAPSGSGKDVSADAAKREATRDERSRLAGAAARGNAAVLGLQKSQAPRPAAATMPAPVVADRAASAPSADAPGAPPPSLADKASETPEAWIKRILELKKAGKSRESSEELARFRKRYPDFALPAELKESK